MLLSNWKKRHKVLKEGVRKINEKRKIEEIQKTEIKSKKKTRFCTIVLLFCTLILTTCAISFTLEFQWERMGREMWQSCKCFNILSECCLFFFVNKCNEYSKAKWFYWMNYHKRSNGIRVGSIFNHMIFNGANNFFVCCWANVGARIDVRNVNDLC